jgi:hypothetical protein
MRSRDLFAKNLLGLRITGMNKRTALVSRLHDLFR